MVSKSVNIEMWQPPPSANTLRRYQRGNHKVRGIMGPVGSSKTCCTLTEFFWIGIRQEPDWDGVRRTRHLVVRDTYGNLENTVLATFKEWYPQTGEGITKTGGKNRQTDYIWEFPYGNTIVHLHIIFAAIGEMSAKEFMKGFEFTTALLNEGDGLPPDVLKYALGRLRYPSKKQGPGPTFRGISIDFNAPTFDNYLYDIFYKGDPTIYKLFVQPGGMSPNAENRENLPKNYYEDQIAANDSKYVNRNVHNKFGSSDHGKPIFPEFNRDIHVSDTEFEPIKRASNQGFSSNLILNPFIIANDAGRTPTAVLGQVDSEGQIRIFDEIERHDMGAEAFARSVKDHIVQRYGWDDDFDFEGVGDPAAANKTESSDTSWLDLVGNILGFKVNPAKTNVPELRIEAVKSKLLKNISGNKPYLLISPRCKSIIAGFEHGYRYKKLKGSTDQYSESPDKNKYSHIHDALQYFVLHVTSDEEIVGKPRRKKHLSKPKQTRRHPLASRRRQ